jgi:hypothetical protein
VSPVIRHLKCPSGYLLFASMASYILPFLHSFDIDIDLLAAIGLMPGGSVYVRILLS